MGAKGLRNLLLWRKKENSQTTLFCSRKLIWPKFVLDCSIKIFIEIIIHPSVGERDMFNLPP